MSPDRSAVEGMIETVRQSLSGISESIANSLFRGIAHRRRLANIDMKIVVSGTRGKSSLCDWMYEILRSREYDAFAKITGNQPVSKHAGQTHEIERDYRRVTLYETARELRKHTPRDAMILENQAISPYTTRVFNRYFGDPDVIVLSNIREDHLSTLGTDRYEIARSLVRAIPEGTHVVNGERDVHLRRYVDREVRRRGATVSHVTVPPEYDHIPGIESVYALNHILAAVGEAPLDEATLESYREKMRVEWTEIAGGRVYNAAEVNDVQSTEMVRRSLLRDAGSTVEPFLYLRGDRRGRSLSFLYYLEELYESDPEAFDRVHIAGETTEAFERKASFPVKTHDLDRKDAGDVLDDLLTYGHPVFLVGNTVADFMRDMETEIDERARQFEADQAASSGDSIRRARTGHYRSNDSPEEVTADD